VTVGETAGLSAKGQPIGVDVGLPRLVLCRGPTAARNGIRFHRIVSRELQHSLDRLSLSAPSGNVGGAKSRSNAVEIPPKIVQIGGAAGTAARRRMWQYLLGDGRSSANDWSLKWNWWS
jgi:hypothetical protein